MPALGAGGVLPAGVGARGVSAEEEDADKIAALGRRGDVSQVCADARVCYNWAPAEWYLGTVKSGTSSKGWWFLVWERCPEKRNISN